MANFFISKGEKVVYNDVESVIVRIVDLDTVMIEEVHSNIIRTVKIYELKPFQNFLPDKPVYEIKTLSEEKWDIAQRRYEIIEPILKVKKKRGLIQLASRENGVSVPTIYRWIKLYNDTGLVSSLLGKEKSGGKGKSRLVPEVNDIINKTIDEVYLNSSKKSINKTIRIIHQRCMDKGVKRPHSNTIRMRIKNLSEELKLRKRYGNKEAKYKYEPHKGHFPGADYPLSVVQIDHTVVDIILVDEQNRNPYKRPSITVAIDVYSRMVLGFYLSFETPGAHGTGLCIAHSILPKDLWMKRIGVEEEWPCWGVMNTIHVDNAKEFRGEMLKKACFNYGINLEFRPPATPHWGGHVERLLGTFSKEIHNLPGTTFSDIKKRKNYNSKEKASFTLKEFEKWLTIYITKIYHNKIHSSINMSPLQKFKEGVFGNENQLGRGLPKKIVDERRLRLDFMPYYERSIQEYGIVINHIYYYDEVLRRYIHSVKGKEKRKFLFRRDPRDISVVYFYDPELKEYFEIPYRNTSLPPISIWEYKDILRVLRKNKIELNEEKIFESYRELDKLEQLAVRETKKVKKLPNKKKRSIFVENKNLNEFKIENIKPFDDSDDIFN
ncbi:DDE-type integrase/transposase/recombinase [Tenacibaculum sp. Mcav3-52]|uniref:Mu transposase C-terminal domain-containing protein n=1 Tax=Tenacibaculum sp. Mcav3-52 TaxID=2917762 RepID=UPI001EF2BAC4|nr:Mu transposase C-terminal domain-containing protein [Tenacibaculum sp. Mcav3-52]MCG7501078.1 DDE-type integrase/transposase/recombinase [Tenacibaculum sp. Mcav3-52]